MNAIYDLPSWLSAGVTIVAFVGAALGRERLEAVDYAVPRTLWGIVIAGAVISIMASYVFSMESLALHGLMTSLLATMIGLLVFFIATTDRPYRGPDAVTPLAYEIVPHDLM